MAEGKKWTAENSGMVWCVYEGDERIAEMIGPNGHVNAPVMASAKELVEWAVKANLAMRAAQLAMRAIPRQVRDLTHELALLRDALAD